MSRNVKAPLLAAFGCALAIVPLAIAAYSFNPAETLDRHLLFDLRREVGFGHTFAAAFANLGGLPALLVMLTAICAIGLGFGRRREVLVALVLVLLPQLDDFLENFYVETLALGLCKDFLFRLVQLLQFGVQILDPLHERSDSSAGNADIGHGASLLMRP